MTAHETVLPVVDRTKWWRMPDMAVPGANVFLQRWRHAGDPRWTVVCTLEDHAGIPWVHVSTALAHRIPTYYELKMVKREFIGERPAVQFFVPQEFHVNVHQNCLHLYAPLDPKDFPYPQIYEGM